jgi:uncharacterized peroxidase-related enzyme
MAFVSTVPAGDARGEVRRMYERAQGAHGYVPNYAKVFSHGPEVMELWGRFIAHIRRRLDPRRYEVATVAAAHALRSSYCSLAHGKALLEISSADDVRAVIDPSARADSPSVDLAVAAFARKVALDASSTTAEDVATLRQAGLTEAEIFDVAATAAARAFFTKLLDALGAEPDAPFLELDSGIREALTPGRNIDSAAPERLPAVRDPCGRAQLGVRTGEDRAARCGASLRAGSANV